LRWRQFSGLWSFGALALALLLAAEAGASTALTRGERLGYARWVAAWRQAPDSLLAHPLYPLGITAGQCAATMEPARRRVVDDAVRQLEDTMSRAWDMAPYRRYGPALKTARDYRLLGRYDEALHWYRVAQGTAPPGELPGLETEMMATAIVAGDSLQFVHQLLSLVGRSDLDGRERVLVLAYRHLLADRDSINLGLLQAKVADRLREMGTPVVLWHAVSLVEQRRYPAALEAVELLVRRPVPPRLEPRLLAWTVQALPDLLLVTGRDHAAGTLYAALAGGRDHRPVTLWARYQEAWRSLLHGRYATTIALSAKLSKTAAGSSAAAGAAVLEDWATRLAACEREGKRYGTDQIHGR